MTGRHRGPKRKLPAGYRALSLQRTSQRATVIVVKCGIARFLCSMHCTMCVFDVRASSSSPRLRLCFVSSIAKVEKNFRLSHSLTHSVTHPAYLMPRKAKLSLRNNQHWYADLQKNGTKFSKIAIPKSHVKLLQNI